MNSERLPAVARGLPASTSRRAVLVSLIVGLFAALQGLIGGELVEARKAKKRKKRKQHKKRSTTPQTPATPTAPQTPATQATKADTTCSGLVDEGLWAWDGDHRFAQTFTALTSGPLASAELLIFKLAGSGGAYILRLSPVDGAGVPTNTVLASASIPNLSVPDEEDTTATFTFANPASVMAGTQYALVLTRPGSNQLMWVGHVGGACPGSVFSSPSQTAAFTIEAGHDFIFTTFVTS